MKIRVTKAWAGALGFALAATAAGGAALAADPANPSDWYAGGHATVADHDKTSAALRLYDAQGSEVTSGSTTAPLAAFAAASGAVRGGDSYATLFAALPLADTAPGAWPTVQVTGTGQFSGGGAVSAPAALVGRPYVAAGPSATTLADVAAAYPNKATSGSFAGVYELRLRTSSPSGGVSTEYAAAYVKVTGGTWAVTSAPVLGDQDPDPQPVATAVTATWPAKVSYGTAASVPVTVVATSGAAKPSGTVTLRSGAVTLATAALSATGTATLTLGRTALQPGARPVTVAYAGKAGAFEPSATAVRVLTVGKAAPGRTTFTLTKRPTAKKAGAATVAVSVPTGLTAASGKATVTLKKGRTLKRLAVSLRSGRGALKLPKLAKGTWAVTVAYAGDARYLAGRPVSAKLAVKAK